LDAIAIPFPDNSFDIVTFKSVLGALGTYKNQEKMINEIYRVLKPGGELWFAENLKASILHRAARRIYRGNAWRYPSLKEIVSLCKPFASKSLKPYGFSAVFGRIESLQTLLGKIDRILDGIIPSRWKYIVFGVARK
jgi:ubiquinone/menaquinone biosynthesis C-methylase UbiE